jgi:E3 ubiquitin-protein ligase RNF14
MVYHGVEPCRFKSGEAKLLYDKYVNASTDDKKQLERTYGKKQLELLVQQTLSEHWVTTQSKPCPHCKVPIQKFEGCNKVTCFKCATYFCWICALRLDKQNPYLHFNDPSSPCYNSLFTNVDVPADEDDDGSDSDFDDDWDESEDDEEDYQGIINGIQRFLLQHLNR